MEFHRRADRVVTQPALALHEVGKRVGTVVAVDGAGMVVRPGPSHAIFGENGAAAATAVSRRLRGTAGAGPAVVYHSADLDGLLEVADRIGVVSAGPVREAARDRTAVGSAMLGAA